MNLFASLAARDGWPDLMLAFAAALAVTFLAGPELVDRFGLADAGLGHSPQSRRAASRACPAWSHPTG